MRKIIFAFLAYLFVSQAVAAESDGYIHRSAMFRGSFEQLKLPANEMMGIVGVNYFVETLPNLYVGGATYGALTGQRGGFFTVGTEVAWHQKLLQQWGFDTGLYAGGGGGGGATALVGGGLMLRPHIDLLWNFAGYRAGLSASQVRFPSGEISSKQIGLVFSIDEKFSQLNSSRFGEALNSKQRGGVGFDRVHAVMGVYQGRIFLPQDSKNKIGLVGFRMEQLHTPTNFWGIEAAGEASGGAAGYAEFLGTAGMETPVLDGNATIGARVAAGMGGGGAVSVGGGQLYKVGGYGAANINRNTHLALEGGYVSAPKGQFRARYVAANLTMDLDHPHSPSEQSRHEQYEWLVGTSRYATAHKDGSVSAMDVVTMHVHHYIGDTIYLSGQAHSAIRGKDGGYSAGLFGAGFRSAKLYGGISAGVEMLFGAAGGGAVDSSGGAIVSPSVFVDWELNDLFALRLSTGRIKSLRGSLNSQTAEAAIKFSYSTTSS